MDGEQAAIVGTLDAIREELESLGSFLRHRAMSRGGTIDRFPARTRDIELLPANKYRHMATFYNDSTAIAYLALGPRVQLDNWTVKLNPADYWESPDGYTGPIHAVWEAEVGQMRVSELV